MNITCPHCQTKLSIPDHKFPKDRDSSFGCPKCSGKIKVSGGQVVPGSNGTAGQALNKPSGAPVSSGAGQKALVCMGDDKARQAVLEALKQTGFSPDVMENAALALQAFDFHIYPMVLIDEAFDQGSGLNALTVYMNGLDMSLRRRICAVLLSGKASTADHMAAMHQSVNFIIGQDGLDRLPELISTARADHEKFYIVFNESMKAVGKA